MALSIHRVTHDKIVISPPLAQPKKVVEVKKYQLGPTRLTPNRPSPCSIIQVFWRIRISPMIVLQDGRTIFYRNMDGMSNGFSGTARRKRRTTTQQLTSAWLS